LRRPTVKERLAQYLNEIVSITIMLLMAIALISGQAAPVSGGAADGSDRPSYQAVTVPNDE
jgi:hypothetical protein